MIREGRTFQIPSLQQRGKGAGIVRLVDSLADLVAAGAVTQPDASRFAESADALAELLRSRRVAAQELPSPPKKDAHSKPEPRGLMERAGAFLTSKGR